MVSESQYQAPDDVLRMWDEINSKQYEISRHSISNKITGINILVAKKVS